MSLKPRICCLDLDTFFVSVERLFRPELVGQPVVVGATPGKRGVVTAASYEVRAFGVHSGMPIAEAYRLAPHAVFVPTRHGVYSDYAQRVRAVLEDFTPEVRTASIDEFFLNFAGCERLYTRAGDSDDDNVIERTVRAMRASIFAETALPASAGVGTSRVVAKIASGLAKPAGEQLVRAGEELDFAAPLPVRRYPGIGPVTEARLVEAGIRTLGQLLDLPATPRLSRFQRLSASVRRGLCGELQRGFGPDRPAFREHDPAGEAHGSMSNERTFGADVRDPRVIRDQVYKLCERLCHRARQRGVVARTIGLKLRYHNFETLLRSRSIAPTNVEARVRECLEQLLRTAYTRRRPVRLLGVVFSNLSPQGRQLELPFDARDDARVGRAIDAVREKFGYDAIRLGAAGERSRWLA